MIHYEQITDIVNKCEQIYLNDEWYMNEYMNEWMNILGF